MRAGQLRHRIRVERAIAGRWAVFASVSANVVAQSGAPAEGAATAPTSGDSYAIAIRYRTDLTRAMRIRWGAETLVIRSVIDVDGRRRESKIAAESWLSYATRHDVAIVDVLQRGAAITFTNPATAAHYDSSSDTSAAPPDDDTIAGVAVEDDDDVETYAAEKLVREKSVTLRFVPNVYGDMPRAGATCLWGGKDYSVIAVKPTSPDGVPIAARVVVSR